MSSKSYHSKEMIARALSIRDIKQAENEWGSQHRRRGAVED